MLKIILYKLQSIKLKVYTLKYMNLCEWYNIFFVLVWSFVWNVFFNRYSTSCFLEDKPH